ncbi:MAG: hypothetical protein BHV87_07810 [Clostridiales bacterium 36_14]|nr:MAG: hypothetical protein BHV87_07810 [Clostridiales bacterium 36_14]DAS27744.1 MAG TPA: replisome organizer [Caudoviricetes sp.]
MFEFMTCYLCGKRFYFGGYTFESYAYKACEANRKRIFCSYGCQQKFLKHKGEKEKTARRKEVEIMAEKRMFSTKIINSDPFKEMPLSAQALYFHLGMNADDEGFLNNAKSVQRSILASEDDLKLLIAKDFIISFPSGVIVIKHWKMHNQIQTSRLKPTQYTEERSLLAVKENKAYTLNLTSVDNLSTSADNRTASVEECSVDKIRLDECSVVQSADNMTSSHVDTQHTHLSYSPMTWQEYQFLVGKYGKTLVDSKIQRASQYKNTYNFATIKKWCEEDAQKRKRSNKFNNFSQREVADFDALESELIDNTIVQDCSLSDDGG